MSGHYGAEAVDAEDRTGEERLWTEVASTPSRGASPQSSPGARPLPRSPRRLSSGNTPMPLMLAAACEKTAVAALGRGSTRGSQGKGVCKNKHVTGWTCRMANGDLGTCCDGTCVACPSGQVLDLATCACTCEVTYCCSCKSLGTPVFCRSDITTVEECDLACETAQGTSFVFGPILPDQAFACDANGVECLVTCDARPATD